MKTMMNKLSLLSMLALASVMISCGGDDEPQVDAPIASFQFAVDGLEVTFTNASKDGETFAWDFGDGTGTSAEENPTYTYTSGGTFTVTLTATNAGGSDDSEKEVTVIAPSENLVSNGEMANGDGWSTAGMGAPNLTTVEFVDGVMKLSNGTESTQSNIAVWQAVEVEAGDYVFSADVVGTGATNTWFEVYFGEAEPADGTDYSDGGIRTGISTWNAECATAPGGVFDGNVVEVGCEGSLPATSGIVTLEAGTIYLVIKSGSWDGNMGSGYTVDNISLMKVE